MRSTLRTSCLLTIFPAAALAAPSGRAATGVAIFNVRDYGASGVEAGATLFASGRDEDYDEIVPGASALLWGEDLVNISFEGRGTVDGEIQHEHRPDDIQDWLIKENKDLMLAMGKSIMRSFPKDYPERRKMFPRTMVLRHCKDVRNMDLPIASI